MALEKSLTALTAFLNMFITVRPFGIVKQKKDGSQIPVDYKVNEYNSFQGTNIKPNWSDLPYDNFEEILNKTDTCQDYLRFSSVCKLLRTIARNVNSRLPYNLPMYNFLPRKRPIPMLLQPCGEGDGMHYLYSTTQQKVYGGLHIPELSNKWIPGSANGWLVTIDIGDVQMKLLNPLTRVQISLPPVTTFQKPAPHFPHDTSHFSFVGRVYISSDPIADHANCLLVAMASSRQTLSYCRIGDDRWKKLLEPSVLGINDVIMHKGLLYAIDGSGKLLAIELGPSRKVTVIAKLEMTMGSPQYLVESSNSLLLVVRMIKTFASSTGNTLGFKVYKLVESQSDYGHEHFITEDGVIHHQEEAIRSTWEEMLCLSGKILFVGYNRCVSLDPNMYPGSKKNCIYFADSNVELDMCRADNIYNTPHDIGIYDMECRNLKRFPGLTESSSRMSSVWLSPNPW